MIVVTAKCAPSALSEIRSSPPAATVATVPSSFSGLPLVGHKRCLDPIEFARDVQRLGTLYRQHEFPDAKVDTLVTTRRPGVIEITFSIVEGEPMRVRAFALRSWMCMPVRFAPRSAARWRRLRPRRAGSRAGYPRAASA